MAVAPLIAMKSTACDSMEAVGMELDRRAHAYVNDIDPSRTHLNLNYRVRAEDAHPLPLELAVERRMGELNVKRKVRDNQVRAMGFIVSTNDALDDEQAHAFLNESLCWFADRYGWENLLAAAEHYDPPPCVHCPLSKSAAAQGSLRGARPLMHAPPRAWQGRISRPIRTRSAEPLGVAGA